MERKGKLKEPTPSPPKKAWLKRRIYCSPSLFGKRWKGENLRLRKWGMEAGWCREWVEKPAGNLLTTQNDYRGKWAERKKGKKFPHILRFLRSPNVGLGCTVFVFDNTVNVTVFTLIQQYGVLTGSGRKNFLHLQKYY